MENHGHFQDRLVQHFATVWAFEVSVTPICIVVVTPIGIFDCHLLNHDSGITHVFLAGRVQDHLWYVVADLLSHLYAGHLNAERVVHFPSGHLNSGLLNSGLLNAGHLEQKWE